MYQTIVSPFIRSPILLNRVLQIQYDSGPLAGKQTNQSTRTTYQLANQINTPLNTGLSPRQNYALGSHTEAQSRTTARIWLLVGIGWN